MPTYVYDCDLCGERSEVFRRRVGGSLDGVCSECGRSGLRPTIFPVGVSFKGSGFYATDSRSR